MRVDSIRMLADWLNHPDYGVNALLQKVPQDASDTEVPMVTVADETRDAWVARKHATQKIADAGPHLALSMFEQLDFEGCNHLDAATWQEAEIAIALRYVWKEVETALGNVFAGRTFRAVRGSIMLLNMHENLAARSRNGVRLDEIVSLHELDVHASFGDAFVTGGMVARYNAIDLIATLSP